MSTPTPDLGVANYTGNWFSNPGFELWDNPYTPTRGWYPWAVGDSYTWYAQAPYPVQQGSQSAGMEVRQQTYGYTESTYWLQSISTSLAMKANDINVTFYWYLDQNPDPAYDLFQFYTRFYSGSSYYYLHYYLNGTTSLSNSSSSAHFLLDGPTQQWNLFSRNITTDYEAMIASESWPALTSAFVCNYARFNVETDGYTTQYLRAFFDDFNLKNTTYTWIGGSTNNGNLEISSGWSQGQDTDAGFVRQSSTAYTGSYSANLTATSTGNNSYGYIEADRFPRATAQNQVNISFWYYIDYQGPAYPSSWSSFLAIYVYNGTGAQQDWFQVRYYLGDGYIGSPSSNSSSRVVYDADDHNTTGSWVYFSRNILADLTARFNLVEAWYDYSYFQTDTYAPGSKVTLLVDSTRLNAAAVNGGDFEDQLDVGDPIHAWDYPYSDGSPYLTVTDTCYSGSKAANLTVAEGTDYSKYQYIERPLNGSRETYLDWAWYLDDYYDSVMGCYAYISLGLRNVTNGAIYYLNYGMAIQTNTWGSNTSSRAYFNVTGVNTLDTWNLMHRDLVHDFEAVFGFIPNVDIYQTRLAGYTNAGGIVSLLLDDFFLYDDPAPVIGTINQVPPSPDHGESVTIIVTNVEEQDLDTVLLHYRTDGGSWQTLPMPEATSYDADIPGQPWDTFVEYYVTANDTWGMVSTDDNGGSYYSYTVTDLSAPLLSSLGQLPVAPTYLDAPVISIDAVDAQSGIAGVVLSYQVDGGGWTGIGMLLASGNTYERSIPTQAWGALVEYYVYATNGALLQTTDDNSGSYYSYTVDDNTNPTVSITAPTASATLSGTESVTVTASDVGSGISQVDFLITSTDASVSDADTTAPYTFSWDTTLVADGEYTITVTAHDNAGNTATDTITVTVNNYVPPPPIPGFPMGAIILALVTSISYSVLRRRRYRP